MAAIVQPICKRCGDFDAGWSDEGLLRGICILCEEDEKARAEQEGSDGLRLS